jgi:hypothetical protein
MLDQQRPIGIDGHALTTEALPARALTDRGAADPLHPAPQRKPLLRDDRRADPVRRLDPDPGMGSPGRLRHDPHRSIGDAITALLALKQQKLRRGYQHAWT